MVNFRMRALFILCILIYALVGFSARIVTSFIDLKTFEEANAKYLSPLIIISLVIGSIYFIWFKKIFPKGYQQQSSIGLVAILLCFSAVSFAINRGLLFTLNTWFSKAGHTTQIAVVSKQIITNRRSNSYRLVAAEVFGSDIFEFKVSKKQYNSVHQFDTLNVYLAKGMFDIYFANEVSERKK